MARLIFTLPSDNIAGTGTITPSTEDATYPKAGFYDLNPAKPFKMTSTTGNIVWDFGDATKVDIFSIIHHNLAAGLEVRFQGNASDSWGSPSVNQALTIPSYDADGFPVNIFQDMTSHSSRTFRF